MKKLIILPMITVIMASSIADNKTLNQFDALVMPLHQETDELFVNIPSQTFAEEKKDEIKTEDVESRGYKKAVKSFQNKYPNIKRTWISWVKEGKPLQKIQKLPLGRKKKLGG